jgi:hypothetical protein
VVSTDEVLHLPVLDSSHPARRRLRADIDEVDQPIFEDRTDQHEPRFNSVHDCCVLSNQHKLHEVLRQAWAATETQQVEALDAGI